MSTPESFDSVVARITRGVAYQESMDISWGDFSCDDIKRVTSAVAAMTAFLREHEHYRDCKDAAALLERIERGEA